MKKDKPIFCNKLNFGTRNATIIVIICDFLRLRVIPYQFQDIEMKIMKKTLPALVILCFLTSGCAEMSKNTDWFPKWDVGSKETQAEKEKLESDSTEKPKNKLSFWEKFDNWVEAGTKTPDQEESGQESPVNEQSTKKEPVKEKLEADSTEKPKRKLSYWKQIEGWFKGGTKTPEQEEPGHKPSVKKTNRQEGTGRKKYSGG